jgi:hypothetical protein
MTLKILRKQITSSLKGGHAFVSVEKALKGIDPEKRNVRPDEKLHSVWEELEHIRIAQEDILHYMIDPDWKSPKWPDGYWSDPIEELNDEVWDETHSAFFTDINNVIELVNDSKIDILKIIPHTTDHTYLREISLIIEHNAYHLGKIVDIRKMLGDWQG